MVKKPDIRAVRTYPDLEKPMFRMGGILTAADIDAAGAVMETDFDATSFLYALANNTPLPKTPAEVMAILSGEAAANFSMNTKKITNVVDPTANQEAATKKYVDDNSGGLVADSVDGTHLSSDFGATAGHLYNTILVPVSGEVFRIGNANVSPFDGDIAGIPTATSVVYDGDSNEDMFKGLSAYDGANFWGKIILHNTTRGNSRKIEAVNVSTNTITTESSSDDWADDDVITCQSTTNLTAGYFDVDLSDNVAATVRGILCRVYIKNGSGGNIANACLRCHPYEDRDIGKEFQTFADLDSETNSAQFWIDVAGNQMMTCMIRNCTDSYISLTIQGTTEYADT